MRLPNPNENQPFDRVSKNAQGLPEWGYRHEGTPDEEIVHIPTNRSNQTYYQPQRVLYPEGCEHTFHVIDMGKREIECSRCQWATSFHPAHNYQESDGQGYVTILGHPYPIH